MINRINLIGLGVKDIARSLAFYKRLGFQTSASNGSTIVFFNNQGTKLELYPIKELVKDINMNEPPKIKQDTFSGVTLACNVKSEEEVDKLMNHVRAVGGIIAKEAQPTAWGGYGGYFQDLDGYYWEVAYGEAWKFDENDMLIIE